MPPHSFLFGHLGVLRQVLSRLPPGCHPFYMSDQIRRTYSELGPVYYLDLWPFALSMLMLNSPETMYQVQERNLPKHPNLKQFLAPLTDGLDIVSMNGAPWKRWRSVFNPGFSAAHLQTLVPCIVRETETFCNLLADHAAKGDVFRMKELTNNLALDVIGTVVLYDAAHVSWPIWR